MNVLVIAPHPDDECIGCGGAVCRHVQRNDAVHAVFLSSGELGLKQLPREEACAIREAEAKAAGKVLVLSSMEFLRCPDWTMGEDVEEVSRRLAPILARTAPGLLYLPHPGEWHPDHKAAVAATRSAVRLSGIPKPELRAYEVWTPMAEYQHVEDISDVMPAKLRALRKHRSQISQWDYVRAIRGLNEYRGVMAGRCRYAEVFQELSAS
jgi:N-acetylglucosamine malate deacetylase 1